MRSRWYFLLVSLLLAAPPAHAAIYQWTDSQGVVHFTDSRSNIPAKYRSKAKRLKRYDEEPASSSRTIPQPTGTPAAKTPRTIPQPAPANEANNPGGHNEQWWRDRFGALRAELKTLQDDIAGKQAQLVELRRQRTLFQRPSDREAMNGVQGEISADEARINDVLNQINALDLEAARAGVPTDWRQ